MHVQSHHINHVEKYLWGYKCISLLPKRINQGGLEEQEIKAAQPADILLLPLEWNPARKVSMNQRKKPCNKDMQCKSCILYLTHAVEIDLEPISLI